MEDENSPNKRSRLGNCEVCGSEFAQYTCPRCELKTCSINCVKIHKKELECSGDRDKTGFVPISKYNNLNLLSDYRLLEDVSRTIDNCRRNQLKKSTTHSYKSMTPRWIRLRKEALKRKISVQYLPLHFTRHKENSSFFNFQSKNIFWKLDVIFPQADNVKISLENCDENERLSSVLSKFIDYENCPDLYKKSLKFYHSASYPGVEVLLKAEKVQTQPSFFVLDLSQSLKENLENRIIIEYPILFVILKSHKHEYLILDSDMKVETQVCNVFRKGKKYVNFTPFSYFDTVNYSKATTLGDQALKSINSSAKELRKYFCGGEDSGNEDDEVENGCQEVFYKKKLNIPTYENLIKQNS